MSTQQHLSEVTYINLKALRNFKLSFEPYKITGIFGTNGSGKSSILHSILCLYKPTEADLNRENFKFSHFFTHTSHTVYSGSALKIKYSFRNQHTEHIDIERIYEKQARWKPRYENRPDRDVYFIGINTCVPEIELERTTSIIKFGTTYLTDQTSQEIKNKASFILNRNYDEYNTHGRLARRKNYIGVKYNAISYSSLAMGAGEQRIFRILDIVFRANKYSLIVIDELDLTLHTDALKRLIKVLVERATLKTLQIIFTSHRQELLDLKDINIRHIHQTDSQTICFGSTTPECLSRLTGTPIRSIEIFVEDLLAEQITLKVIEELNIRKYCKVSRFGCATNAFSLAAGFVISGQLLENILILLDGDVYVEPQEKTDQIKKNLAGNETDIESKRDSALALIKQFSLPTNNSPEQYILNLLKELTNDNEIVQAALSINCVAENHDFINNLIEVLGFQSKEMGFSKIVVKLAESDEWTQYTSELRTWLIDRKTALML